jgi:hypothetical protein
VASYVTVPEGTLTLTDIALVDERQPWKSSVHFLRYGVRPNLDVGVGFWATPGKMRPAVNWQVARALKSRPAVLVGYGSEPLGRWEEDGLYLSLVKGFGSRRLPTYAFAAYFHELSNGTRHLIGGVSQPLGPKWTLFVGRYPFNQWDSSLGYHLSPRLQLGVWACDFGRKPRLGLSLGTGWNLRRRGG